MSKVLNPPSAIMLVVLLLPVALMGCSGDGTENAASDNSSANGTDQAGDDGVELTMWTWTRSVDEEAIEEYQEMNPHVSIDLQYSDQGDVHNNLITAFSSGSGAPDVVGLEIQYVERFKDNPEHFHNLFDLGAESIANDYLDWKWEQGMTPDGEHLLALPIDIGPMAMAYNTERFEEAGLPTDPDEVAAQLRTWEDFIEAGIQVRDQVGIPMLNEISQMFENVANQHDVRYFDHDNNLIIEENEQVAKAWNLAIQVHEEDLSANLETQTTEWGTALNNGDFAVQFAPSWMMNILKDNASDAEGVWAITTLPEGGGNWGGSFLGIPAQSDYPEEAYEFIEWLLAPEQQLTAFERYELFPSTPEVFESSSFQEYTDDFFATPNIGQIYADAAEEVIAQYLGAEHTTVNDAIGDALGRIEDGVSTPEESWQEAMEEIDRQLAR